MVPEGNSDIAWDQKEKNTRDKMVDVQFPVLTGEEVQFLQMDNNSCTQKCQKKTHEYEELGQALGPLEDF